MYTMDDIRQIAIQIERNGENTYRSASERVNDPKLAKILKWLADEEKRHGKWFESLPTQSEKVSDAYEEMEAMGRSLLKEMVEDQTFSLQDRHLVDATDVVDLMLQSLGFEQDTILFYDMLKSFIDDKQAAESLELVISEERGHVRVLEKLKQKFVEGEEVDLQSFSDLID